MSYRRSQRRADQPAPESTSKTCANAGSGKNVERGIRSAWRTQGPRLEASPRASIDRNRADGSAEKRVTSTASQNFGAGLVAALCTERSRNVHERYRHAVPTPPTAHEAGELPPASASDLSARTSAFGMNAGLSRGSSEADTAAESASNASSRCLRVTVKVRRSSESPRSDSRVIASASSIPASHSSPDHGRVTISRQAVSSTIR